MRRVYSEWTDREVAYLRQLRAEGRTAAECATALNRTPVSVRNKCQADGIPFVGRPLSGPEPLPPEPPPPPRDPVAEAQERMERKRMLAEEKRLMEDVAGERSLRAMVDALFRDVVPAIEPPPPYRRPPSKIPVTVQETALFNWSDWHYGEVVEQQRVRGFNAYDQDIAKASVEGVVRSSRDILSRIRRGGYEFPRAVIAVNGDLVTGTIHELEKHSNGKVITQSVTECGYLLADAIRSVAADFDAVDVFCTVGNHGRLPDARRMEQKSPLRNWDAFVYFFAQCALRDVPNVTVTIPDAYAVGYDIGGWRFLQQHGHEVKSWAGIPWYGIERYVSRITALEASRDSSPDYYIFGHFHTATTMPTASGEMFVNGSLIGATEYGVNSLGKADRPTQWLLGVHPDVGVTHRWPVYPNVDRLAGAA